MDAPVRPVRHEDAQDLFGLISLCFAEYPGCYVDPHDDLRDLLAPARAYEGGGGSFWATEDEAGRVAACVAIDFPRPGTAELHRLYVRPDRRGRGIGAGLVRHAETVARDSGAGRLVFWSDTRFKQAHRLYDRLGFAASGEMRELGDISRSQEYFFEKRLDNQEASGESS